MFQPLDRIAVEMRLAHIGSQRKFPIHLWKITTTDPEVWDQVAQTHSNEYGSRVLNLLATKQPHLISQGGE